MSPISNIKYLISALIITTALCLLPKPQVFASEQPPQVLIINQVRGTECCEPGSLENLQEQVDKLSELELPAFFTLRYDALTDPEFINYLQSQISNNQYPINNLAIQQFGVFLEITPSLAAAANVEYKGSESDWYEAQHAYLLGYSIEERKRLVDELMRTFYAAFGYYPELTTAWVIDTPTLNYLHDKYGVKVHQITREQWGTDSYTLYGGVEHYPYPASRNWLFQPDYEESNSPLIVRQTVSDPLYNYGDSSSGFTSQPNDYLPSGKSFSYFEKLLEQVLFQQPSSYPGFALLGLENSMGKEYQEEFFRQLEFVKKLELEMNITIVNDLKEIITVWKDILINVYTAYDPTKSTQTQSWWVNTPQYRARIVQKGNQLALSDYRIINAEQIDPYSDYVAANQAYLVSPFLLDGSRFFQSRGVIERFFYRTPWWQSYGLQAENDIGNKTNSIILAKNGHFELIEGDNYSNFSLVEEQKGGKGVKIGLLEERIEISPCSVESLEYLDFLPNRLNIVKNTHDSGFFLDWEEAGVSLIVEENNGICSLEPIINRTLSPEEYRNSYFLFPEVKKAENPQFSVFSHNSYAIAGRNPVRIVLIASNEDNFPAIPTQSLHIETSLEGVKTSFQKLQNGVYFFELESSKTSKVLVKIYAGEGESKKLVAEKTIYFAPNCKTQFRYCLMHPVDTLWYLQSSIRDKFRK